MRPGGKSNGESPFFEKPILSFEERVGNVALIPACVASASRSTIQNSQDAANASSGSSGVTKSTTAQHRTASDAEPSGAKASPPAGTVTKSPSSRPVRRCSSGVGTDAYTYPGRDQVKQIAGRTGLQSPTACLHAGEDSGSDFGYAMNVAHHGVDDWDSSHPDRPHDSTPPGTHWRWTPRGEIQGSKREINWR